MYLNSTTSKTDLKVSCIVQQIVIVQAIAKNGQCLESIIHYCLRAKFSLPHHRKKFYFISNNKNDIFLAKSPPRKLYVSACISSFFFLVFHCSTFFLFQRLKQSLLISCSDTSLNSRQNPRRHVVFIEICPNAYNNYLSQRAGVILYFCRFGIIKF
jgi:hypothetical protein